MTLKKLHRNTTLLKCGSIGEIDAYTILYEITRTFLQTKYTLVGVARQDPGLIG